MNRERSVTFVNNIICQYFCYDVCVDSRWIRMRKNFALIFLNLPVLHACGSPLDSSSVPSRSSRLLRKTISGVNRKYTLNHFAKGTEIRGRSKRKRTLKLRQRRLWAESNLRTFPFKSAWGRQSIPISDFIARGKSQLALRFQIGITKEKKKHFHLDWYLNRRLQNDSTALDIFATPPEW